VFKVGFGAGLTPTPPTSGPGGPETLKSVYKTKDVQQVGN